MGEAEKAVVLGVEAAAVAAASLFVLLLLLLLTLKPQSHENCAPNGPGS